MEHSSPFPVSIRFFFFFFFFFSLIFPIMPLPLSVCFPRKYNILHDINFVTLLCRSVPCARRDGRRRGIEGGVSLPLLRWGLRRRWTLYSHRWGTPCWSQKWGILFFFKGVGFFLLKFYHKIVISVSGYFARDYYLFRLFYRSADNVIACIFRYVQFVRRGLEWISWAILRCNMGVF